VYIYYVFVLETNILLDHNLFVSLACLMEDLWNVNNFCSVVSQKIFAVSQLL